MTTLHMETDAVRAMANQLKQVGETIRSQAQALNGSAQSIDWLGPSRDEFVNEVNGLARQIDGQVEAGEMLAQRAETEVLEWEEAAASLTNRPVMSDVAVQTMSGEDIRIYQIGKNEYAVFIRGTNANDSNASNNFGSAFTTGLGVPSDFQKQVEEAIRRNVPPGATIDFMGHSQGGIVAQNLANDSDIYGNYHVASVTTFGSPTSAPETPGVKYARFAAEGDVVPFAESEFVYNALLFGPVIGTGAALLTRTPQTNIVGTPGGPIEDHGSYGTTPSLLNTTPAAYTIDPQYFRQVAAQNAEPAKSGLAVVQKNLFSGDPLQVGVGLVQAPITAGKTLLAGAVTYGNEAISHVLPESARASFDSFNDRVAEGIERLPTEQLTENVVHGAVNTAGSVANAVTNTVTSTANAVTNTVTSTANAVSNSVHQVTNDAANLLFSILQ